MDGIADSLARHAEIKNAHCHGCGNTSDTHLFHLADERVKHEYTGAGTVIVQLCGRCDKDSHGVQKGLLIDIRLMDPLPFMLN